MKTLILMLTLMISNFHLPSTTSNWSLCNVTVNSVSVSGSVGYSSDSGVDFSEACLTFTGTVSVCDGNGNELATLSFTALSSGCDEEDPIINPNEDPLHTLQDVEAIYNLSALNEGYEIDKAIPLAYPNPAGNVFTLTNLDAEYKIALYAAESGQLIETFKVQNDGSDLQIDVSHYKPGTYYLKTLDADTRTDFTQTIVIE